MKFVLPLVLAFTFTSLGYSQSDSDNYPIVFIYDASGSMWSQVGSKTRMQIASEVLSGAVNKLDAEQEVGLVAYGHREEGDCEDVEFLVDVNNKNKEAVTTSLKAIKPLGRTPLAFSAMTVLHKLRDLGTKATIILITDGIESCGGNICEVVRTAKAQGIDFRLHIIGFGLKEGETKQLKCATEEGGGNYYDAEDAGGLSDVLDDATNVTVDEPEGNISIYALKNGEPLDAYIKVIPKGEKNSVRSTRTYKDTGYVYVPPGEYSLEVEPLEGSKVDAIIVDGVIAPAEGVEHRTVSFDGGTINVITTNNGEGWDAVVRVYPAGEKHAAFSGRTYGKSDDFELNAGIYDVEVQALQVEGAGKIHRIDNIVVVANQSQDVTHEFETGIAMLGANSSSGLVDAVVRIVNMDTGKTVTQSRTYKGESSNPKKFILTPATYKVEVKALGDHKGKTDSYTISVTQAQTVEKTSNF